MKVVKIAFNMVGFLEIEVEGFFLQRFINLCTSKGIMLNDIKHRNQSIITCRISKDDYKSIMIISRKTKCKIKIIKKGGVPFLIHRYRKRKIFFIMMIIIIIFSYIITRFIWNIEVTGDEIDDKSVLEKILNDYYIKERKFNIKY